MPWKPTSDMTRDELVQQLEQLREIVERLAAKIMPIPDDDRTLHDMSREELLGHLPRPAVDLDALLEALFEAGADAGTVRTGNPDMIGISIDGATAEEINAIWARPMGRLELHQRLAASLAQAKAGERAPGSGAYAVEDAFGEARRLHELIVTDPDIRGGMPTLKGSRLGALEIADQARLESPEELYAEYPTLKPELLAAAIEYAKQFGDDRFHSC